MKANPFQNWIRYSLLLSSVSLVIVLFVPMWRIDLDAPQYPEGLRMLIYANKLGGNVDIINGLNHYIGMKTLHANDFMEFTILPYIIIAFAAFFILTAFFRNRKLLYALCIAFVSFGIIAMADFWQWEYNYGHNLNPDAAIIVPGMAYQPPLIGFKQLLNFGAYSIPDIGGWIFISVGALLLMATVFDFFKNKSLIKMNTIVSFSLVMVLLFSITSCSSNPKPIKLGIDNCQFCKMTISDPKFGAEILTLKGKVFKFDEINCLLSYLQEKNIGSTEIKDFYFVDFSSPHLLVQQTSSLLLKSDFLSSPMNGNIIAFANKDSLLFYKNKLKGETILWSQLANFNY